MELVELHRVATALFRGRCGNCLLALATEVHEIRPRSAGRKSLRLVNMLPVCRTCHQLIHQRSNRKTEKELLERRELALSILRREKPEPLPEPLDAET